MKTTTIRAGARVRFLPDKNGEAYRAPVEFTVDRERINAQTGEPYVWLVDDDGSVIVAGPTEIVEVKR